MKVLSLEKGVVNYMEKYYKNPQKIHEAYQRYIQILEVIKGDDIAENLLDSLIEKVCDYTNTVVKNEHAIKSQSFRLEGEDYRKFIMGLDERRKRCHDALISNLHAFNRYIIKEYDEEIPIGGIFSLDPDQIRNRYVIAEWAIYLYLGIWDNRQK